MHFESHFSVLSVDIDMAHIYTNVRLVMVSVYVASELHTTIFLHDILEDVVVKAEVVYAI